MKKKIAELKTVIPFQWRSALRRVYLNTLDIFDIITFRSNRLIPPRRDMFVGNGNFIKVGEEFLEYFIKIGGLKPDHRVLDVGSGIGRMAVPLTGYLTKEGRYDGFDTVKKGVAWCRDNISPKFPNFHFHHADIYNKEYNPGGSSKASEYSFPFNENTFDFVFLTSVFTHMLPDDMENYISEIWRVLKPKGRCLITYFIMNGETVQLINTGKSSLEFKSVASYWTTNPDNPEAAVAYDEKYILNILNKHGIEPVLPVYNGSWSGRLNFLSYQDILTGYKR